MTTPTGPVRPDTSANWCRSCRTATRRARSEPGLCTPRTRVTLQVRASELAHTRTQTRTRQTRLRGVDLGFNHWGALKSSSCFRLTIDVTSMARCARARTVQQISRNANEFELQ